MRSNESPCRIRSFEPQDLEIAVRLWETSGTTAEAPSLSLADLINALAEGVPAVVAEIDGTVVGAALARISGQRGWVQRLVIAANWRGRGIGGDLLSGLERRLSDGGVDRLVAIFPSSSVATSALFSAAGWSTNTDVTYAEKTVDGEGSDERLVRLLGGSYPSHDLWESRVQGDEVATVIERRVVAPLVHTQLADTLGLRLPNALLLFGPPGTGKTSFAQAVAGRLQWPLVEWRQPALAEGSTAQAVAALFDAAAHLERVVLFVDEIDEIAGARHGTGTPSATSATNELLKALSRLSRQRDHLLVASTNHISRLDPALLRPGRFDLMLPVGHRLRPPDATW